jgi:hypothetical protein
MLLTVDRVAEVVLRVVKLVMIVGDILPVDFLRVDKVRMGVPVFISLALMPVEVEVGVRVNPVKMQPLLLFQELGVTENRLIL